MPAAGALLATSLLDEWEINVENIPRDSPEAVPVWSSHYRNIPGKRNGRSVVFGNVGAPNLAGIWKHGAFRKSHLRVVDTIEIGDGFLSIVWESVNSRAVILGGPEHPLLVDYDRPLGLHAADMVGLGDDILDPMATTKTPVEIRGILTLSGGSAKISNRNALSKTRRGCVDLFREIARTNHADAPYAALREWIDKEETTLAVPPSYTEGWCVPQLFQVIGVAIGEFPWHADKPKPWAYCMVRSST